jgi:polysaccharide deacetylase 2 family uncharacterized protein YibQ
MAKRKSGSSGRLKFVAFLLCLAFVAALGLYRYCKTENGRAFLLDAGIGSRFAGVQAELETKIVKALKRYGVRSDRIDIQSAAQRGGARPLSIIHAVTPPDASLVQINGAITMAVRGAGGRVRSCREGKDGTIITMEIGTRCVLTNRCIIRKGSEKEHQAKDESRRAAVVALCVDDFGFFHNSLVKDFLAIDIPLTISVIPGLKYSEKISREAAEAGKDMLCHLPMEAESGEGDGGEIPLIRASMKASEIEKALTKALETTPGAVGINNHMGSKATADRRVMETVLRICHARGLYFFDSLTTPHSVVRKVAKELGVPEARNDLFIDGGSGETRENMKKLLSIATRKGAAIGIIHVKSESLEDLRWMIDEARKEGIDFVKISELIGTHDLAKAEGGRL